jgi:hypothetical protein
MSRTSETRWDYLARAAKMLLILLVLLVGYAAAFAIWPQQRYLAPLATGGAFVLWGLKGLWPYWQARRWVAAAAVITEFEEAAREITIKYSAIRYLYPLVRYECEVDGKQYVGDTASFEIENIWVPEDAQPSPAWRHWAAGSPITIFHDPADPRRSVVFPALSSKRRSYHLAIIAAGCLIVGVGVLLAQLKS